MIALWIPPDRLNRIVPYLVALAVGVLLGDAFIHLIPDAIQRQGSVSSVCLLTLCGVFIFLCWKKYCAGGMTITLTTLMMCIMLASSP